jgi:hypothetical protein
MEVRSRGDKRRHRSGVQIRHPQVHVPHSSHNLRLERVTCPREYARDEPGIPITACSGRGTIVLDGSVAESNVSGAAAPAADAESLDGSHHAHLI